mmetsp:Transcript_148937/g.478566  ORF Transcript_148937/g.478566 Transcript_148937/m.478566 type:complete len:344 (+) Transcript_148937:429-1460(+)
MALLGDRAPLPVVRLLPRGEDAAPRGFELRIDGLVAAALGAGLGALQRAALALRVAADLRHEARGREACSRNREAVVVSCVDPHDHAGTLHDGSLGASLSDPNSLLARVRNPEAPHAVLVMVVLRLPINRSLRAFRTKDPFVLRLRGALLQTNAIVVAVSICAMATGCLATGMNCRDVLGVFYRMLGRVARLPCGKFAGATVLGLSFELAGRRCATEQLTSLRDAEVERAGAVQALWQHRRRPLRHADAALPRRASAVLERPINTCTAFPQLLTEVAATASRQQPVGRARHHIGALKMPLLAVPSSAEDTDLEGQNADQQRQCQSRERHRPEMLRRGGFLPEL